MRNAVERASCSPEKTEREKLSGLLQRVHQTCDCAVQVFVGPAQLFNLVDRVQHGRMVFAAELSAISGSEAVVSCFTMYIATCRGKAMARVLLELSGPASRKLKCSLNPFLDQIDGDAFFLRSNDVPQHLLRRPQRNRRTGQRGVGHQPRQRAFQLPHVDLIARAMYSHVVRQAEAVILRLFLQDGDLGFEVRRLDVRNQSPFEPRTEPFFDRIDVLRQAVRGNHNLFLLLVERVEV